MIGFLTFLAGSVFSMILVGSSGSPVIPTGHRQYDGRRPVSPAIRGGDRALASDISMAGQVKQVNTYCTPEP
jgi:hypothetical protein